MIGSDTTIVIRCTEAGVHVEGSSSFAGGAPVLLGGKRDGIYGEWQWDGTQLEASVDRLGMFPLYYSELPDGIALSTSITELIKRGVSPEIDWAGLWLLFRWELVSCQTAFRHIKVLPVGGKLIWKTGSLSVTESYPEIRIDHLSRDAALDAYIELFQQAMKRRLVADVPIRLPLSGGRDSRHIFLELVRLNMPPTECYTSSHGHLKGDLEPAQQLCARFGVPHRQCSIPEDTDIVALEMEKNQRLNFQALEHAWSWLVAQTMGDANSISYDGIGGDVLSAGLFHDDVNSQLYRSERYQELAEKLAPSMELVLVPASRRKSVSADAHDAMVRELLRYRNYHNPMMLFFFFNRTRRTIAPTIPGLYGRTLRAIYCPYVDRDLFDFLVSLPEEMCADKTFHTEAIRRAYSSAADIPYSKTLPLPHALLRRYAMQGIKFMLQTKSSEFLNVPAALLRLVRCLAVPRYLSEAGWIVQQSIVLHQLGGLQATSH